MVFLCLPALGAAEDNDAALASREILGRSAAEALLTNSYHPEGRNFSEDTSFLAEIED